MTDKEIIKTLTKAVFIGDSPIGKGFGTIIDKQTVKETIDFINRQKAEIDNLEYTLLGVMHFVDKWLDGNELKQDEVNRADTMRHKTLQIIEEQQAEIERLKTAKPDAIKEFAEKMKGKLFYECGDINYSETCEIRRIIDTLVKEMVGDEVV